jgi:hypothetical protein
MNQIFCSDDNHEPRTCNACIVADRPVLPPEKDWSTDEAPMESESMHEQSELLDRAVRFVETLDYMDNEHRRIAGESYVAGARSERARVQWMFDSWKGEEADWTAENTKLNAEVRRLQKEIDDLVNYRARCCFEAENEVRRLRATLVDALTPSAKPEVSHE